MISLRRSASRLSPFIALFVIGVARLPAQTANIGSLTGKVLADSTDLPIASAEISFPKLKLSARSDSLGNFQIAGVPLGPHELIVRRVGYEPYSATMTFRSFEKVEADFLLKAVVTKLDKVNVKAAADKRYAMRLADFEERRKFGTGRFLTADVFEKAEGQDMSQVIVSLIPGVRTIGKGSGQVLVSTRPGTCPGPVQVILNGLSLYNGYQERFNLNSIYTGNVIGVEYYTVATTPAQFNGTGGRDGGVQCGTIVIWTK